MVKKAISHEQIREALKLKDINFSDIAAALKLTSSHVSRVSRRETYSKPVADAICKCLDLPLEEVFGDVEPYFSPNKRGPKDRSKRTSQIVTALREGQPIPPAHNSLSVAS
ncbi:helix-turn-helix transcriptional regulator [Pseudoalteromonas elyakovii]|uniref:HTH cro/C1-type domain-containing protein n=1 Tax=Pseudoalteromonas gelatinilytica TaxID=1703256 RepID=A0ABQ1U1C4_9GAMM|nr:helix-turn-helix domain-containing protein [Pseudoalteromonas profundi]MBU76768.1 hypothetical protein [Pseudoalteromonadaceae bacterium]MDC3188973.1 helix-turn-helix transcriptional regulator [Pseudoalteromonas elyakovii]GGF07148.1 hypothetical protein GCM10008027_35080 [Pseudoalteromonas profundi]|tara:strand:- start:8130 stop:8462 length:333 start_codon:yes stop_codon:yes gene_type:complete